ncbi:MAG: DsbA family protein [archaeon]|nr:DsbA family protein [archaeon]
MTEKNINEAMYLPISLIVSALLLSGTIFVVGGNINESLSGLSDAMKSIGPIGTGNTGNNDSGDTGNIAPSEPTVPSEPVIDMEALIDDDAMEGNPDAPVTIVEFSDFQCPFCESFYTNTLGKLRENYIDTGKVRVIFRDFPLSFHPNALPAAEATECANEQGKFWEMHDKIFENQDAMSTASYKQWAADLGLNTEQFNTCYDSSKYQSEIQADFADGQAAGVSGTPTFFINGQKVVGAQPFSVFEQIIEAELAN